MVVPGLQGGCEQWRAAGRQLNAQLAIVACFGMTGKLCYTDGEVCARPLHAQLDPGRLLPAVPAGSHVLLCLLLLLAAAG